MILWGHGLPKTAAIKDLQLTLIFLRTVGNAFLGTAETRYNLMSNHPATDRLRPALLNLEKQGPHKIYLKIY